MFLNEATKLRAQTIIKGLEKRNMHGVFCATKEDALKQALSYIKEGSSVSWGGSMSVSEIGLMDALKEGNYHLDCAAQPFQRLVQLGVALSNIR